MSFEWKTLVKTVAPVLGTALGGPFGGMASRAISSALLGDDETASGPELDKKLSDILQHDTDALLKLKQADQAFDERMKELDVDILKIAADDRAGARTMAINTSLLPQFVIGAIFISGFVVVLYSIFSGAVGLTPEQKDLAMYLLGILSAGIVQIMNFFFGSSAGSKAKTDKLAAPK